MVRRSVQTWARSTDIVWTWRDKSMGIVSSGRYLETSRMGSRESVLRTSIWELRCNWGSRYMVGIEWTGGLAFGDLGFNFIHGPDARYVGDPRERHDVGNEHDDQ